MVLRKEPKRVDRFGVSWTKWFMPSLYFPSLYRNKFPNSKPSPSQLKRYDLYSKGISFGWLLFAWSVCGYVLLKTSKREIDYDPTDDKARRLAEIASYTSERQLYSGEKTQIVTFGWDGIKKEDVTEEVAKVVLKGRPDKYKDPEYLSVRANMSKDDPKFDVDFWGAYFKKIDHKRSLNERIGDVFK